MPDKTGISWTDATWTIVTGCSKVSSGCKNCFAERLAPRLAAMGKAGYTDKPWTKPNAEENVTLRPERLEEPLRWRKPRRVFVTSMGDLFHELVPFEFIDKVFAVMALAPQHTFQVLTKRPERMAEYLTAPDRYARLIEVLDSGFVWGLPDRTVARLWRGAPREDRWPLPNVWLGTSVENQKAADERIPHLLRTPAAVRFLSCEPLLGPVDLIGDIESPGPAVSVEGFSYPTDYGTGREYDAVLQPEIDWVIAGGESGPRHRNMDKNWARSLRNQCIAANVPFFFKQDSGSRPETNALLDGEEWHQFPETTEVTHD